MIIKKLKKLIQYLRYLDRIPYMEEKISMLTNDSHSQLLVERISALETEIVSLREEKGNFEKSFSMMIEDSRRDAFYFMGKVDSRYKDYVYAVRTSYPVAINSDDHIYPCGTMRDNTRHPRFVKSAGHVFGKKIRVMDLGCAGGGLVLDFLLDGHDAIGIEGSDYSQRWVRAEWGIIPSRLFTADITKQFDVLCNELPVKFDLITAWEVLEHIDEQDLPVLFGNIRKHLADDGLFVGSVAMFHHSDPVTGAVWHVTVKPRDWWHQLVDEYGFEVVEGVFEIEDFPRGSGNPRRSDWSVKKDSSLGFHMCLRLAKNKNSAVKVGITEYDQRASVISAFHSIYGHERGDNFSKSLSNDGFKFFDKIIGSLPKKEKMKYLEIGSFEGVSMAVVGTLLKKHGYAPCLTSIDPYPIDRYWEDNPVLGRSFKVPDKSVKSSAFDLYGMMGLDVNLIEESSGNALVNLLKGNEQYDLIYVDGHHENISPLIDITLSLLLLSVDGVLVVDDWIWPDVLPIKELLDRHLVEISRHPLIVAYKKNNLT